MQHNISIYDTGKLSSYDRRNEGLTFASGMACMIIGIIAMVMMGVGYLDPAATFAVGHAGVLMLSAILTHGLLFVTHRNFNLNVSAVKVMDAIYSLPKADRKKYKVSKAEVLALTHGEADRFVVEVDRYRRSRTANSGLNRMLDDITEYNKVVSEWEG